MCVILTPIRESDSHYQSCLYSAWISCWCKSRILICTQVFKSLCFERTFARPFTLFRCFVTVTSRLLKENPSCMIRQCFQSSCIYTLCKYFVTVQYSNCVIHGTVRLTNTQTQIIPDQSRIVVMSTGCTLIGLVSRTCVVFSHPEYQSSFKGAVFSPCRGSLMQLKGPKSCFYFR